VVRAARLNHGATPEQEKAMNRFEPSDNFGPRLQALARQRLQDALDATSYGGEREIPRKRRFTELKTNALEHITPLICRDFHAAYQLSEVLNERQLAGALRRRHPWLLDQIDQPDFGMEEPDLREKLVHLTCFVAGVYVPLMAGCGRFHLAVQAVRRLQARIFRPDHRDVLGAGSAGSADPLLRYLILSPLYWSLSGYMVRNEFRSTEES
jgi:hypothetical protein